MSTRDNSNDAYASIVASLGALQAEVYMAIDASGTRGMTGDEIEVLTGLTHQTVSARITELSGSKLRLIENVNDRKRPTRSGRGAAVWTVRGLVPKALPSANEPDPACYPKKAANEPQKKTEPRRLRPSEANGQFVLLTGNESKSW